MSVFSLPFYFLKIESSKREREREEGRENKSFSLNHNMSIHLLSRLHARQQRHNQRDSRSERLMEATKMKTIAHAENNNNNNSY
jgi:hypothetical protein